MRNDADRSFLLALIAETNVGPELRQKAIEVLRAEVEYIAKANEPQYQMGKRTQTFKQSDIKSSNF